MAVLDGFKIWKNLVATPVRWINGKSDGKLDQVANVGIQYVDFLIPGLGKVLADQWDSDMQADKAKALSKLYQVIGKQYGTTAEIQRKLDDVKAAMQQTANTTSRATQTGKVLKLQYDKRNKIQNKLNKANAVFQAASSQATDVLTNSRNITAGEVERRSRNIQDVINKYEEGNK